MGEDKTDWPKSATFALEALGTIDPRPEYHTARYIYPVGYRSSRVRSYLSHTAEGVLDGMLIVRARGWVDVRGAVGRCIAASGAPRM